MKSLATLAALVCLACAGQAQAQWGLSAYNANPSGLTVRQIPFDGPTSPHFNANPFGQGTLQGAWNAMGGPQHAVKQQKEFHKRLALIREGKDPDAVESDGASRTAADRPPQSPPSTAPADKQIPTPQVQGNLGDLLPISYPTHTVRAKVYGSYVPHTATRPDSTRVGRETHLIYMPLR